MRFIPSMLKFFARILEPALPELQVSSAPAVIAAPWISVETDSALNTTQTRRHALVWCRNDIRVCLRRVLPEQMFIRLPPQHPRRMRPPSPSCRRIKAAFQGVMLFAPSASQDLSSLLETIKTCWSCEQLQTGSCLGSCQKKNTPLGILEHRTILCITPTQDPMTRVDRILIVTNQDF